MICGCRSREDSELKSEVKGELCAVQVKLMSWPSKTDLIKINGSVQTRFCCSFSILCMYPSVETKIDSRLWPLDLYKHSDSDSVQNQWTPVVFPI